MQFSETIRNARADNVETTIGVSAILYLRTGTAPALTTDADTGTLLAQCDLPSDWLAAAAAGVKAKLGTWEDLVADGTGTPGHFRIKETTGTTTHIQGTAGVGSGELSVNGTLTAGQTFTIVTFQWTEGNA